MKRLFICVLLSFAAASPALAESAARVGDTTSHGGSIVGPGAATVNIEGQPAAVQGDQTTCPLFDGSTPHVGGPIVTGSASVRIGGNPAVRTGDVNAEVGSSATMIGGASTVNIGP